MTINLQFCPDGLIYRPQRGRESPNCGWDLNKYYKVSGPECGGKNGKNLYPDNCPSEKFLDSLMHSETGDTKQSLPTYVNGNSGELSKVYRFKNIESLEKSVREKYPDESDKQARLNNTATYYADNDDEGLLETRLQWLRCAIVDNFCNQCPNKYFYKRESSYKCIIADGWDKEKIKNLVTKAAHQGIGFQTDFTQHAIGNAAGADTDTYTMPGLEFQYTYGFGCYETILNLITDKKAVEILKESYWAEDIEIDTILGEEIVKIIKSNSR